MLGLAITGLVLRWPRKILAIGSASSWKRTNFDLHDVLGFYSSLVTLFITLSGVLIAFEGTTDPLVRRLNHEPDAPAPQSAPVAGGKRISVDEAIAIGERTLPGAFASNVGIPNGPKAVFRILKRSRRIARRRAAAASTWISSAARCCSSKTRARRRSAHAS